MTLIPTFFKSTGRTLLVAAILGGASLAAAPAMAASPSFSFGFGVQNGQPSFGFGIQDNDRDRPGFNRRNACMNNNQVVRGLSREGYRNVRVTSANNRRANVEATKGRYNYDLVVNKCNGNVDVVDRDRRGGNWQRRGNSFGMQFNFAN